MANITAYDYLPQRTKNRLAREDERRRQTRIARFLPDLSAHRYVETTGRLTGLMELHYATGLRGSSERWVKATIHDPRGSVDVIVPRIMCGLGASRIVPGQCTPYPVTVDICAPTPKSGNVVEWVDRTTHYTVQSRLPVVLRRHA